MVGGLFAAGGGGALIGTGRRHGPSEALAHPSINFGEQFIEFLSAHACLGAIAASLAPAAPPNVRNETVSELSDYHL